MVKGVFASKVILLVILPLEWNIHNDPVSRWRYDKRDVREFPWFSYRTLRFHDHFAFLAEMEIANVM